MKFLSMFLFIATFALSAIAADVPFYIGTQTDHTTSKGIYLGRLDTTTGKLGPLTLAVETDNPNFLALSPDLQTLFAAQSTDVGAFKIQPDGTLSSLNKKPSGGDGPCHVQVDGDGRHLFVANYSGGNIACFELEKDGSIGNRSALMPFAGSGPDPKRQTKPYAHSIYVDSDNKYVYSCDLGTDSVWIFRFYSLYGALVPTDPEKAKVPPGSGPRHLAFHPNGRFVYVANEMGHSVSIFSRNTDTGALTPIDTVSTLTNPPPTGDITTAEIVCDPTGNWLYVSNRGCETIAVFDIGVDGKLSLIQSVPCVAQFPRSFALDPTGHWMIVAGQKGNEIAVLKVDPQTGKLSATDQTAQVGAPVCVLFDPKK